MTPQLQQAIRLLQLPVLDLNAEIQEALEENIMLEMEDLPDVPQTSDELWQSILDDNTRESDRQRRDTGNQAGSFRNGV